MFDPFDFDAPMMARNAYDLGHHHHSFLSGQTSYPGSGSSSGSDFFLCDDNSDSESCSIYNSDQENNDDKMWVFREKDSKDFLIWPV